MGEKALLGKETEPETQKQANGKGFEREIYYLPKNGDTPAPQVNVRTAPINLNLGKEAAPAPKVKKHVELIRKKDHGGQYFRGSRERAGHKAERQSVEGQAGEN